MEEAVRTTATAFKLILKEKSKKRGCHRTFIEITERERLSPPTHKTSSPKKHASVLDSIPFRTIFIIIERPNFGSK